MKKDILDQLKEKILVCDGAMGTMLYSNGIFINRCFDELNLSQPGLVKNIHQEYIAAGADIIETNSFGANRYKLQPHGFDDKVYDINYKAAQIAREVAAERMFVAGAMGPLGATLKPYGNLSIAEAEQVFQEQAIALAEGGVDLIILETFGDLTEITTAIKAIKSVVDLPVIAQMTFNADSSTLIGASPETVVKTLRNAGADILGANCSVGPKPMLEVIERMSKVTDVPLSAQPNAGNPNLIGGRYIYLSSPEYHAEYAKRFITAGASIIGGCCGTTPAHIKAIVNAVRALQPRQEYFQIKESEKKEAKFPPVPLAEKSKLARKLTENQFVTSVEVVSPHGVSADSLLKGISKLVDFGVDAINIPDGPRASARMSPLALALLIQNQLPIEPILHYCCRDRNLLGMQSDLLGAYALGLRNVLAITGDPPKLGDYPDATAVFDVDSIGLTRMIHLLNTGFDIAMNSIGKPTGFFTGVGANPGAVDLELEINRLHQKLEAGAEYVLTQPVFDLNQFETFLKKADFLNIPILAGIMPLKSYRTVEFLNNEVPGITVPEDIAKRMQLADSAEAAKTMGIKISQELLEESIKFDPVKGTYLMPPFGKDKFEVALKVLEVTK